MDGSNSTHELMVKESVQNMLVASSLKTHQSSSSKPPCLDDTDIVIRPGFQGIKILILFNVIPRYLYGAIRKVEFLPIFLSLS